MEIFTKLYLTLLYEKGEELEFALKIFKCKPLCKIKHPVFNLTKGEKWSILLNFEIQNSMH